MFNKFFRRSTEKPAYTAQQIEQMQLDVLRFTSPDNQLMQLHCDRMQTALNVKWS